MEGRTKEGEKRLPRTCVRSVASPLGKRKRKSVESEPATAGLGGEIAGATASARGGGAVVRPTKAPAGAVCGRAGAGGAGCAGGCGVWPAQAPARVRCGGVAGPGAGEGRLRR